MHNRFLFIVLLLLSGTTAVTQTISQFEVFAGRFDYLAIGNTLNALENGQNAPCELLSESSASLNLETDQTVIAAYLYWAGSGTGDFEVMLNETPISAQRTFADEIDEDRPFFAGYSDITDLIIDSGNIEYTFSGLDLEDVIPAYCPTGTNFGGWSIVVVFEDMDLPLNQVNIFDGLESVSQFNNNLTITLNNLNVLDNQGARIGFIAWEGDSGLAVNETLSINGNLLGNPPLNPINNQFNGTNSFTNSDELFNMDIDVYDIENNISVGDDSAIIELTSGQDFVMINTVITVLNSQLPDAVISLDDFQNTCNSRDITLDYTVTNQGTETLAAGTAIAFYGDGIATGTVNTSSAIQMGESLVNTITITVVPEISDSFTLQAIVDDPASVTESNEENNESNELSINLGMLTINDIDTFLICDDASNDGLAIFNIEQVAENAIIELTDIDIEYYLSLAEATSQVNPIINPESFENNTVTQTVYLRFFLTTDDSCFSIIPLMLEVSFQPNIQDLNPLEICDDSIDNDMQSSFNLTVQNSAIFNDQTQVTVSYYLSLVDAEAGLNPLVDPENYTNTTNPQVIYTRLVNNVNPDCYDIGFFDLIVLPVGEVVIFDSLLACNEGFEIGTFDLTANTDLITIPDNLITGYYTTLNDAELEINAIADPVAFQNTTNPQTIYVRIEGDDALSCFEIGQFSLGIENCPPFVPEGFSPNSDGINDTFEISGLKDVFENYELFIYSRLGNLIYEGDNDVDFWDGIPNQGIGGTIAPTGVYYWVLQLNDSEINDQVGWVYLNR